ncbi:hypothetical protein NEMBOFW57_003131 [Staphylotrichum longicolle]|uniref:Fungal lipase-type domain-containing protein n=1 Tax=Staphylotrichum longicolle TaxID=669026 RepID=A0AAD4I4B2_9PEZI|nr:hypothetical protein NEMBOFW57_003131 [Staphylotrichum longicolle]
MSGVGAVITNFTLPNLNLHFLEGVSTPFFASLERASRLVDITYCVGTSGIAPPFSCVSRCKEFPSLRLVRTWNTGVLLSDSCGYIAVDGDGDDDDDENGSGGKGKGKGTAGQGEIVVAFRGTYSIANTVCDNCTVHMGFMASWRNAREVVIPALVAAREEHPGYRVHLVGHSLGGAVAALAALELRLGMGWRDVLVTTFGEPRVGNAKLAEYLDRAFGLGKDERERSAYRRVTHVDDPVPLLPLSEWGYRSHAGEVYISKSSLPPGPEDLKFCRGDNDPECLGGADTEDWLGWVLGLGRRGRMQEEADDQVEALGLRRRWFPARLKLWQLFFAHRDYFWRLGLCLPGGDPADWGRDKYNLTSVESTGDSLEPQDL